MADLDSLQASDTTKIVGSDATGVEQTPVQSTSTGALHTNLRNAAGTEMGTSVAPIKIDPTGTTTQPISQAVPSTPFVQQNYESYNSNLSKCFCSTTNNPLKGTTESPLTLLTNPSASGKSVSINRINFAGAGTFRIYFIPTITTNGTLQTVVNKKLVAGAQGNSALVFLNPALSANGTLAFLHSVTAQNGTSTLDLETEIILPAGFSITITATMIANSTVTNCSVRWMEI